MQVLLKASETKKDIECTVCKQGFRIYWERTSPAERETMRAIILGELARQHDKTAPGATAHPATAFNLPEWSGSPELSGAAMLGGYSGVHRVTLPTRQS